MASISKDYVVIGRSDVTAAVRAKLALLILEPRTGSKEMVSYARANLDKIAEELVLDVFNGLVGRIRSASHEVVMIWISKELNKS